MKNFLLIGASSGIGASLRQVLSLDHKVYGTYNQHPIESQGNVTAIQHNVLDDTLDLEQLPSSLDGLVYCPGSLTLKPFHRFKEQGFIDDFRLHVTGAIKVIQQVLPLLKAGETPSSIVLFSTIAVQQGFGFHAQVSTSKGAIEGLTRALAAELSPYIRVNAIAPSLTDTPLAGKLLNSPEKIEAQASRNPMLQVGEAVEIAEFAAYLLSDKAKWITGQIHHLDGGYSTIRK